MKPGIKLLAVPVALAACGRCALKLLAEAGDRYSLCATPATLAIGGP